MAAKWPFLIRISPKSNLSCILLRYTYCQVLMKSNPNCGFKCITKKVGRRTDDQRHGNRSLDSDVKVTYLQVRCPSRQ